MSIVFAFVGVVLVWAAVTDKAGMQPSNWAAFGFGCLLVVLATILHLFGHEED